MTQFDGDTRIDSARTFAGRGCYWTTAYLVDDLFIDAGCAHAAIQLAGTIQDKDLTCIINTHSHEDHIGANGVLQGQIKYLRVLAHP
jgi:glyoxylase-like metal-dependent hydrolase (beta-lactamase superfamily II)